MTTSTSSDTENPRERFVRFVQQVCRRPGNRSALRSGLGRQPEQSPRMHALVAPWAPLGRPDAERAYYTVAALIAAQPPAARDDADGPERTEGQEPESSAGAPAAVAERPCYDNLGRTLAVAVTQKQMSADGTEKRLHLLTRQPVDGLHRHLPALVRHLRTDRVPVNWAQLLDDLSRWRFQRDQIAKRWLQSYYRTLPTPSAGNAGSAEE